MGNNSSCCQPKENSTQIKIAQKKIENENQNEKKDRFLKISHFQENNKLITEYYNKPNNINKIIKIQSIIKGKISRSKLQKQLSFYLNLIIFELESNIIDENTFKTILLNNKGEKLSKIVEKKYGKYIPEPKIKLKYTYKSPPVYINKSINKDIYIGSYDIYKNFIGYGIIYKEDGSKIEGIFFNNKLNGNGRFFMSNGDYYIGNFINGTANGKGTFVHSNGNIYIGNWLNDKKEGEGEEIYIDKSYFKGLFKNNNKILGKLIWNDGSYYKGEIKNDKFNGKGEYFWKEGRYYKGNWVNGEIEGKGIFTYLDGSYYEGEFHKGLRNGFGKYVWDKNKIYEGFWINGKQHGNGVYIKNDKIIKGIWINGKLKNFNTADTSVNKNNKSQINLSKSCQ